MGRIRSIKPEFCTSENIAAVDRDARLHLLLMGTYADDDGRGLDNPKLLKAALWPLDDDVTVDVVEGWQQHLAGKGRIVRYQVDGKRYFEIANFREHQHPKHPRPSDYPPPSAGVPTAPATRSERGQVSPDAPATRSDRPESLHGVVVGEGVGVGEVPLPVDERASGLALVAQDVSPAATDPVTVVFDAWCTSTGKRRAVLDAKRRKVIKAALKLYPLDDVVDAVDGWRHSPHHKGVNERHTVYNELDLLLRDAAHIEQFRDLARAGPQKPERHAGIRAALRNRGEIA